MCGIGRQHIRAQHQKANGCGCTCRTGKICQIGGDAALERGVVQTDVRIINRGLGHGAAPILADAIATDQEPDHLFDIVIRPAQPILHGQEPSAQILGLSGDEAQDFWQAAQHLHLAFARFAARL